MWCWRPKHIHPRTPIREENYHCCCKMGKAKIGFAVFLVLDAVFLIFLGASTFLGTPDARLPLGIIFGVSLPIMLLGILSLITLKPLFMQAYGIIYILQLLFLTFSILTYYILYVTDNDHLSSDLPRVPVTDYPRAAEPHTGKNLRHTFLIAFAFLIFIYLRGWITLNFYKYVRDRQLAMEQLGSNRTHASDIEYQEGKLVR
ncbi:unnamed protein product, partial [Mesorhabditis belari]|uniref:Uncharacterized protein n=1 Tax=Mesorhabditis belari TaxID=2138241 RepID=A0AAF3EK31_9BILA